MQLTMMSDILFREIPNPARLREIVARAFDLPISLVNVRTVGDLAPVDPASRVQLIRQPERLPGDFADWYGLGVDPALVELVTPAVDAISVMLGMPLLTEADDDAEMTLHLPDGTHHTVRLAQGDDDSFRITPAMRRLIDAATGRGTPSAVASE